MAAERLCVSIIVHGESQYIVPCLASIDAGCRFPVTITVVANTGENESIRQVRRQFPAVRIWVNTEPRGFAANHNHVMANSEAAYIALLNDDLIVQDQALDILTDFLDAHPEAAIAGPRLLNPDGSLQPSTYGDPTIPKMIWRLLDLQTFIGSKRVRHLVQSVLRPLFPRTLARFWSHDQIAEAEIIAGAALMIRRTALEQVGPMAEVTRAYGEESEWHLRFRRAGWKLYLVPEARMIHYGGQSTGGERSYKNFTEMRKSLLYYFSTHRPPAEYHLLRWLILITHTIRLIGNLLPSLVSAEWRERRDVNREVISMAWHWSSSSKPDQ